MYLINLWVLIDLLLIVFSLPCMRNTIMKQEKDIVRRTLNSTSTTIDLVEKLIKEWCLAGLIMIITYVAISYQSDDTLRLLKEESHATLIIAFLPIIISFIQNEKENRENIWLILCVILGIIISIDCYIDMYGMKECVIMWSLFVPTFFISFGKMFTQRSKRVLRIGIGIRKDLYNRTSSINLQMSKCELIRKEEMYIDRYLKKCHKMDDLCGIEFVSLLGMYEEEWYKRTKKLFVTTFVIMSFIFCSEAIILRENKPLIGVVLILFFIINVYLLKQKDEEYLYRLAIRLVYFEWGYCLYFPKGCRFIGNVQLIEWGKCSSCIYALLDFVAFLRIVYLEDDMNKTDNLLAISSDLSQLYEDYVDKFHGTWVETLPLWITAFCEKLLYNEINDKIKRRLASSINDEEDRKRIHIFLQSFSVDFLRRMPNNGDIQFVKELMIEVRGAV